MIYDPYLEAEARGINIFEATLRIINGYYRRTKADSTILIDSERTEIEKRCILAHEIEHDQYTVGIFTKAHSFNGKLYQAKHEKFIDRKSAEKLMPLEDIKEYLKNNPEATLYELADFFSVTERIAHIRIEFLVNNGQI